MVVIYIYAKKRGYTSSKRYALKEKTKIILEALPCLLMIIIVIGGIIGGIFTATEGAVVAVVYSLILSLVFYKSIKAAELPASYGQRRNDRNHHIPYRCIKHNVMGYGIYRHTGSDIGSNAWYQQ